jgi:hypothetical protein
MIQSRISKREKGLWAIAFIIFTFITAIVWIIVKPNRKR